MPHYDECGNSKWEAICVLMGDKDLTQRDVPFHLLPFLIASFILQSCNSREDAYFFWAAECC